MRRLTTWWRLFGAVATVVGVGSLLVVALIAAVEGHWPVAGMDLGLVALGMLIAIRRIDRWIASVLPDPAVEAAPRSR